MVVMTVVEEDIHRGIVSKIRKIIREEVDEFQWIRDIEPVEYRFFEVYFCEEMDYWTPPDNAYQALAQQLVILKSSHNGELAKLFVNFIKQDDIKDLIRQQGYATL